jgi:two-component system cell cycle response regulator DivK
MTSKLILHVEDTWECQQLARAVVTYHGYEIVTVDNGEDGVAFVQSRRPDLILMDINLPGIDGLEATRQIRQLPSLSSIPIIALSATDEAVAAHQAAAAGCNTYLTKPYSPARLIAAIQQLCQQESAQV